MANCPNCGCVMNHGVCPLCAIVARCRAEMENVHRMMLDALPRWAELDQRLNYAFGAEKGRAINRLLLPQLSRQDPKSNRSEDKKPETEHTGCCSHHVG